MSVSVSKSLTGSAGSRSPTHGDIPSEFTRRRWFPCNGETAARVRHIFNGLQSSKMPAHPCAENRQTRNSVVHQPVRRIDVVRPVRIMKTMRSGPSTLARSLLLLLAISLGSLQCVAAGMDDGGTPAVCCTRDGDADEGEPSGSGTDSALSACPGSCPGTSVAPGGATSVDMTIAASFVPLDSLVTGRTLAPDPHPPRHRSAA